MQNDYLWDKRKPMFSYNTDDLVGSVNRAISAYKENGYDVIYIEQMFPNIITNKWFIGFSVKGTEGAELYSGLDVVSDIIFENRRRSIPAGLYTCESRTPLSRISVAVADRLRNKRDLI